MIEKFSFELHAPKVTEKLILVKQELELRTHVVMKLLAYLLFYQPRLKIEVDAGMHYKPDLLVMGDHGVPEVWIDVGQVALKKVNSLSVKLKTTRIILVKETHGELEKFRKVVEKKLEHPERIEYLAFDKGFVAGIAEALNRGNHVTLYDVMENVIGVAVNDEVFESTLYPEGKKMSREAWLWLGVTVAAFAVCTLLPPRIKSDKWRKAIYWSILIPVSLVLMFYVYPAGIEFFKRLAVGYP